MVGIDERVAWLYAKPPLPGVDCSELAEDLAREYPGGQLVTFCLTTRKPIKVSEFGRSCEFEYHTVYVRAGRVYDPRFAPSAIPYAVYVQTLSELNGGAEIEVGNGAF